MAEVRRHGPVSAALLLDLLTDQLRAWRRLGGRDLDAVDLGGGTGGLAAHLADLGFAVTVVDPSPDALASLHRRTVDAGLEGRVRGVQGDANDLVEVLGSDATDVVVCHRVLEIVDDRSAALAAIARILRPGGAVSLLVTQRPAAVLAQALAGHLVQARQTLADPRQFTYDQVIDLVTTAGLEVMATHGIGAVADHMPEAVLESDPGAWSQLLALERQISQDPSLRLVAPTLHVFARRP